jgi:hypothetical protein
MSKKTVALSAAVSGVLGLVIGAVGGASSTSADPTPSSNDQASSSANHLFSSPSPSADAPPAADPAGTYSHSCDYILGDFTNQDYRFVADATIHNTGNIGTVDTVTARWFQAGTKPVVASKTVKVLAGGSKRVGLTEHVTSDQIDLIQALGFADNCKVKVTIGDTFGEAS